jgi:cell division protein FtsI (penicillin-binding protein 3)
VSYVYEPGSTFKLVTIAGALEEKLTNPDEVFDCQMGSIVYNGMRIRDSKPHGLLPVWGVLSKSSDVGSIKIALRLGEERFYKYIRGFGFGQQTGIELPGETRGMTKPVSRWSKVSIAAIAMGQEIGVSPLQLAGLVSTFANDGVWVAPRVVTGAVPPGGALQTVAFHPGDSRRVISPYTAAEMRAMMEKVVLDPAGTTGGRAILEGYSSAGKTGTAQKVDPATGAYSKTKYIGSFAGFAPVNNPQIVVAVILDSAVGLHQGGQVAAPVFKRISQQVLEYLHVPHDMPLAPRHQLLLASRAQDKDLEEGTPDHPGEPLEMAEVDKDSSVARAPSPATAPAKPPATDGAVVQAAMRQSELLSSTSVPDSAGNSSPQQKAPNSPDTQAATAPTTGTVVLDVEQGGIEVPSFVGKTVRGAVEAAQDAGLELEAIGSGLARQQSPPAGTHVAAGAHVTVQFGR